jgi:hypothetical protein
MHKIFLSILLFCCFSTNSISQIRITIKSSTDKVSLPYATIVNKSSGAMYSGDKNGESNVIVSSVDSFHVSYVGYNDVDFVLDTTTNNKTIYLEPKIATLKAIVLQPCKLTNTTILKTEN